MNRTTRSLTITLLLASAACGEQPGEGDNAQPPTAGVKKHPVETGQGRGQPTGKPGSPTSKPAAVAGSTGQSSSLLTYPRDKERVMATVNGVDITLEEIVAHIDSRHFRGFAAFLSTRVGQFEIRRPRMAEWVRQYADIVALRAEARARGLADSVILGEMGAVYAAAFADYKTEYRERHRRAFPRTPGGIAAEKNRFQKARGLGMEVEGLLNSMVPDRLERDACFAFYKKHTEEMSGRLTVSQIFVPNRDPKTGELFQGDKMKAAKRKVDRIKNLLERDGSNFEEVSIKWSEDRRSASDGGRLDNLDRFDSRMPARFCSAAWGLRNGEWTGPFATRFGLHFVKRVKWIMVRHIINPDHTNARVRKLVRDHRKEALLFEIREQSRVTLFY